VRKGGDVSTMDGLEAELAMVLAGFVGDFDFRAFFFH
jgi:hypothetical protein